MEDHDDVKIKVRDINNLLVKPAINYHGVYYLLDEL
jgi:hypothetical protein